MHSAARGHWLGRSSGGLARVEAQAPVSPPEQAGCDRVPDGPKVRITSKAEVAIAQIEEALRPTLEGADFQVHDIALEAPLGAKVSSKSVLQLKRCGAQGCPPSGQLRGAAPQAGRPARCTAPVGRNGAHLHQP